MALLFLSGFELNSVTDAVEFTSNTAPVSVVTTSPRSGTYHGRVNAGNGFWRQVVYTANQTTVGYIGVAVRIAAAVNATTQLVRWSNTANAMQCNISLKTDNTLVLLAANGTQIGSASAALTAGTWYYVELKNDASGTGTLDARLNGVSFASGANSAAGTWARALIGTITGAQTTSDIYFDDWKINDSGGTGVTSWPGIGKLGFMFPNAAGDANAWNDTGGAAGTTNNYTLVDEQPPNDVTDFVQRALLNAEDLYNMSASGTQSYDTINSLCVGVRFNNGTADATTSFKLEIEKTGSGTKTQSASIIPNSVTWRTNSVAAPDVYPIAVTVDPDGAAWTGGTGGTLDSCQVGVLCGTVGVFANQVSTVWVYFDYTQGVAPTGGNSASLLQMMGVG